MLSTDAISSEETRFTTTTTGLAQLLAWQGDRYFAALMSNYVSGGLAGAWGMVYMVAGNLRLLRAKHLGSANGCGSDGSSDGANNLPVRFACFSITVEWRGSQHLPSHFILHLFFGLLRD